MTPAPVELRPVRDDDAEAVGAVVRAAFAEDGVAVAALVDDLRTGGHVRAEIAAVGAVGVGGEGDEGDEDGAVVGHVMLTRAWLDTRERLVEVLVLSPLSVAPDRQRAGTGTALVAAAIEAARGLGAPALFLEGAPDYYGRRGFEAGGSCGFERPSARIPAGAFQVAVLDAHEPWMRGRLVYPDPFWARDSVGLRDPLLAELEQTLGGA